MPAKKASAEFFARPSSTDDSNETVAQAALHWNNECDCSEIFRMWSAVIRSRLPVATYLSIQFLDKFQFRENWYRFITTKIYFVKIIVKLNLFYKICKPMKPMHYTRVH